MKFSILILAVLFFGSFIAAFFHPALQAGLSGLPIFAPLAGVAAFSAVLCLLRRTFTAREFGFYLAHLGVVMVLVGALLTFLGRQEADLVLYLDDAQPVRQVRIEGHGTCDLGFGVRLKRFDIERYDPSVVIYSRHRDKSEPGLSHGLDREEGRVPNGSVARLRTADRQYTSTIEVVRDGAPPTQLQVSVNHPACIDGWRLYQMSYDRDRYAYSVLRVRRDPGRGAALAGLLALVIGVAVIFYLGRGAADG